jgi:DNA-binding GntR family transcriptional regulator
MMLEERAGYLATLRATDADVEEVEKLLRAMDGLSVSNAKDATRFAERNRAFHERLYAASGRPHLCRLLTTLRVNVERYIRIGAQIAGDLKRVREEHQQIFNAFRRRDAQTVGRLCREHCAATCERLIERLAREAEEQPSGL